MTCIRLAGRRPCAQRGDFLHARGVAGRSRRVQQQLGWREDAVEDKEDAVCSSAPRLLGAARRDGTTPRRGGEGGGPRTERRAQQREEVESGGARGGVRPCFGPPHHTRRLRDVDSECQRANDRRALKRIKMRDEMREQLRVRRGRSWLAWLAVVVGSQAWWCFFLAPPPMPSPMPLLGVSSSARREVGSPDGAHRPAQDQREARAFYSRLWIFRLLRRRA